MADTPPLTCGPDPHAQEIIERLEADLAAIRLGLRVEQDLHEQTNATRLQAQADLAAASEERDSARDACLEWDKLHRTQRERAEQAEQQLAEAKQDRDGWHQKFLGMAEQMLADTDRAEAAEATLTALRAKVQEWKEIASLRQKAAWDSVDDSAVSIDLFTDELTALLTEGETP